MNNDLASLLFRRRFSLCLYKNRRLPLAEMEFSRDFTKTERGDKYPLILKGGGCTERVSGGKYSISGGIAVRFFTRLSPLLCLEVRIEELRGECGFLLRSGEQFHFFVLGTEKDGSLYVCADGEKKPIGRSFAPGECFSVQIRTGEVDFYLGSETPECAATFPVPFLKDAPKEAFFRETEVGLFLSGLVTVSHASAYLDSGIAQADIRPVRYENGEVLTEGGRMYFTLSVRVQKGSFQGIFSWVPGTCDFEMTGALFFDAGDGRWENDVASSLLYDRRRGKWLLWFCSFSHGHIPGWAEMEGDPRFGVNVADVTLLPSLSPIAPDTAFGGKSGDEDPDLFYDVESGKWLLALCRLSLENNGYRYVFFSSDDPFSGFSCIGVGQVGGETGGSFVRYGGKLYFVCGNDFSARSEYRIYELSDLSRVSLARFDFPDGGFRGWGSVFTVRKGTRTVPYWLTFDRVCGSGYNWSYGNLYCFEGTEEN